MNLVALPWEQEMFGVGGQLVAGPRGSVPGALEYSISSTRNILIYMNWTYQSFEHLQDGVV